MANINVDIDVWQSEGTSDQSFLDKVADELLAVLTANKLEGTIEVKLRSSAVRENYGDNEADDEE